MNLGIKPLLKKLRSIIHSIAWFFKPGYFMEHHFDVWRSALGVRFFKIKKIIFSETQMPANFFEIPIIINSYNRLSYLSTLINWLEKAGYKNIFIFDNLSTYPPLLEFYKKTPHKVVYLGKNKGCYSMWRTLAGLKFTSNYYVYTDPDLVPSEDCPENIVERLFHVLEAHPKIEKAGPGLRIDNLPDHYKFKNHVIEWEQQFWKHEIEKGVYNADIDTTFALYRPGAVGHFCNGARLGYPYVADHLPWHEDSKCQSEELQYYIASAKWGHWTSKDKN